MYRMHKFLQGIYEFLSNVSKKSYRTCAIIASGTAIVTVIVMNSKDFDGAGKNNVTSNQGQVVSVADKDEDQDEDESLLQVGLTKLIDGGEVQILSLSSPNITNLDSEVVIAEEETKSSEETIPEAIEEAMVEENSAKYIATTPVAEEMAAGQEYTDESGNTLVANKLGMTITKEDYEALIRITHSEAGNQDDIGKMLVTNVVINRKNDNYYPNTIIEVIFQNNGTTYQFQPVKNGTFYSVNVTQSTIDCVNRVLAGEDYSQGALYFTRQTASTSWFNTKLTFLFNHGDHYFYK